LIKYLLDINVLIHVLRNRPGAAGLTHRVRGLPSDTGAIYAITREELIFGARFSKNPDEQTRGLREFLKPFPSLPDNDAAANQAAGIRADLGRKGTPIGPHDVQLAAIALTHNLTLVTHNTAEFGRVEGLRVEDWELVAG